MEEGAPYSARQVAALSLKTSAGKATVTQACEVFGISRSAYYAAKKPARAAAPRLVLIHGGAAKPPPYASAEEVMVAINAIVEAHPAWGVRKVWATMRREPYKLRVAHRRVHALMSSMGLCLPADGSPRSEPSRGHVVVEEPNRRWSTDLTTVWTKDDGVVAVVPVLDNGCRTVLGVSVTKAQDAPSVLAPVRAALAEVFGAPENVPHGFELLSDHGPQYTGSDCEELCREWRLEHLFAPVGRPTGNGAAERLIRTMKEECIWLRDWTSAAELWRELQAWMKSYNDERPHQALRWQTPRERRGERLGEQRRAA